MDHRTRQRRLRVWLLCGVSLALGLLACEFGVRWRAVADTAGAAGAAPPPSAFAVHMLPLPVPGMLLR